MKHNKVIEKYFKEVDNLQEYKDEILKIMEELNKKVNDLNLITNLLDKVDKDFKWLYAEEIKELTINTNNENFLTPYFDDKSFEYMFKNNVNNLQNNTKSIKYEEFRYIEDFKKIYFKDKMEEKLPEKGIKEGVKKI